MGFLILKLDGHETMKTHESVACLIHYLIEVTEGFQTKPYLPNELRETFLIDWFRQLADLYGRARMI